MVNVFIKIFQQYENEISIAMLFLIYINTNIDSKLVARAFQSFVFPLHTKRNQKEKKKRW